MPPSPESNTPSDDSNEEKGKISLFFEICTNNNLCVIIIFRFGQSNHRFNEHQFC